MTLFDECKLVLASDIFILDKEDEPKALNILYQYPVSSNKVEWGSDRLQVVELNDIISNIERGNIDNSVYIITDTMNVPIFKSGFKLVVNNLDDVSALSLNIFIVNNDFICFVGSGGIKAAYKSNISSN